MVATAQSWQAPYKGGGANLLLESIEDFLNPAREAYSNHTVVVNSSGTGKSRMVDELARTIITIPMCLRSPDTQGTSIGPFGSDMPSDLMWIGFPPPDIALRTWLLDSHTQLVARQKAYAFLVALLINTENSLKAITGKPHIFSDRRCAFLCSS